MKGVGLQPPKPSLDLPLQQGPIVGHCQGFADCLCLKNNKEALSEIFDKVFGKTQS